MSDILAEKASLPTGLLAGRSAWIVSDGVAGHLAITRGVAETLGLAAEVKTVAPRSPWKHLAPNGPADPRILKSLMAEALPEFVLGAGRQAVPFVRALKRAGQGAVFTIIFQSPRTGAGSAHLIWVPEHDRLRGANVISTLTPPHRFTAAALAELRGQMPAEIAQLPAPRVALLLGGPGAGYAYDRATMGRLETGLRDMASLAGSFMITASRRTPPELLALADTVTRSTPRILWGGDGTNPYPQFLAQADLFLITADSVNMAGEAAATGKPIYVFTPSGGRAKFRRFHAALEAHGATRPLPERLSSLGAWQYEPLRSAEAVAAEIERRWLNFRSTSSAR
jgi:uncharacterized protein